MKTFTKFKLFALVAGLIIGSTAFGQITQRGTATEASDNDPTFAISKPTGLAVGDVMLANIVQSDNGGSALSDATGSGWTFVRGGQFGVNGNNSWWGTVLYKVATAADVAATSFSFAGDADVDGIVGGIVAFYNVSATGVGPDGTGTGPFDVAAGTLQGTGNASSATITAPGITTATANAAVIMFGMVGDGSSTSGWAATSPASLTEAFDIDTDDGADQGAAGAWALKAAAGATNNGTATTSNDRNGGVLIALRAYIPPPTATISPTGTRYILVGGSVSFTATAGGTYDGSGNYTYTWVAPGATIPGANPNSIPGTSDTKSLTYSTAGTYTVKVTVTRGTSTVTTSTTTVVVAAAPAVPNMWASASSGTTIAGYIVVNGIYVSGPTNIFTMTFPGSTTGGTTSAAIGKNDQGGPLNGYFYWLPNTSGNGGVVEIFAATSTGATPTRIGSADLNGGSSSSLGFVRLGIGPDGYGWILAGDATNLYLAKFLTNGVSAVTITTVPLILSGGLVSTFQNGDVCVLGDNRLYALANDGGGVTQIFIGSLNNPTVTLTKKWDLVDAANAPFTGSVNGVAFDAIGSLYITTAAGLYFIDQTTVNNAGAGTVQCTQVDAETGLQDLGSAWFPSGSTLPVTLVNFLGSYNKEKTTLMWETENMSNFKHFEIERSSTGSNFVTVGIKNPQGNPMTRTQYSYVDDLAGVNGSVFYYRLKMVDIDGRIKYSNIVVIRKDKKGTDLIMNPNPVVSGIHKATANFTAASNSKVIFNVIDMSGKVVLTQQNTVSQGNNSVTINNLDRLQSGMYMLQLNDGETRTTAKFYVVH